MNLGKIAIVGSGAIGCYYGGHLARNGQDVHFLMRSDLEVVRKRGLEIRSPDGDFHLAQVQTAASTAEIGPVDLVIIALKATGNAALAGLIPPLLHEKTSLLTLQNGLGNEELLAENFGADRVMGGLCFVCLNRVDHGVVEHYGHGSLSIGEFTGPPVERTLANVDAFKAAGIEAKAADNLMTERWRKLVWNVPFNGLSIAAGGVTVDHIMNEPELRQAARELMLEVIHAAAAAGHSLPESAADHQLARTETMGAYKPSSLVDFVSGSAVEVEAIWGEPCRRARAVGAKVPSLSLLYALLKKLNPQ